MWETVHIVNLKADIWWWICLQNDPLLKDLHPYVTLEEVNSMIALEYGQAMVVNVQRADGDVMRKKFWKTLIKISVFELFLTWLCSSPVCKLAMCVGDGGGGGACIGKCHHMCHCCAE